MTVGWVPEVWKVTQKLPRTCRNRSKVLPVSAKPTQNPSATGPGADSESVKSSRNFTHIGGWVAKVTLAVGPVAS